MPKMAFTDRHGRTTEIEGPEPIDAENSATAADLKRLRPKLASSDPATVKIAVGAAELLFARRDALRGYAERWNALVDEEVRERPSVLIAAIDALDDGDAA